MITPAQVHELRALGWTHARIAAELGCSESMVQRYLKMRPDAEVMPRGHAWRRMYARRKP